MMKNNQRETYGEIVYVNETEEGKKQFQQSLPGDWSDIKEAKDDDVQSEKSEEYRLFQMEEQGKKRTEIKGKLHLDMLLSDDCFILVSKLKLFIWVGKESDKKEL